MNTETDQREIQLCTNERKEEASTPTQEMQNPDFEDVHQMESEVEPNLETQPNQTTIESLLQELKDTKITIIKLDTKIDSSNQDLSSKSMDFKELKDLITSQNDQITMLYTENKELR